MPKLTLCLLCALATVARPASAAPVGGLEPAKQEELTLLFHGALQLGQALNGVYRATEARLTKAGHSLGLYGHVLGLLGQEVSQGRDAAQELRTSLLEMQVEEDALKLQAAATAQALREVAQGQQMLRESMQRLEVRLRGAWLGHARQEFEALKAHADKQSHIVWALTGHVQRQGQEMAAQQHRLRQIQERLHTRRRSRPEPAWAELRTGHSLRDAAMPHAAPKQGGAARAWGRPGCWLGPAPGHRGETEAGGATGRGHGPRGGGVEAGHRTLHAYTPLH